MRFGVSTAGRGFRLPDGQPSGVDCCQSGLNRSGLPVRYPPVRPSSETGQFPSRKSLRMNILTSNSFEWNILRGKVFVASLFSIFCGYKGGGGVSTTWQYYPGKY